MQLPLHKVLAVFQDETVDLMARLPLAAGFVVALYKECSLPEMRDANPACVARSESSEMVGDFSIVTIRGSSAFANKKSISENTTLRLTPQRFAPWPAIPRISVFARPGRGRLRPPPVA